MSFLPDVLSLVIKIRLVGTFSKLGFDLLQTSSTVQYSEMTEYKIKETLMFTVSLRQCGQLGNNSFKSVRF